MKRSSNILNELEVISPLVAGIGNANIFTVPSGYFDTVADTVLASVKNEVSATGGVPEGYFDSLSNNILSKIEGTTANELQRLSPLLAGIKKVNPFEVPENYFEQETDDITLLVTDERIPAALVDVNKEQPFEVPVGYFEQLADNILLKTKEQAGAKVVSMPKRSNAIWKYAAAAVFTGAMVFGVYKYTGPTPSGNIPGEMSQTVFDQKLNDLAEEDIIKYLDKNGTHEDFATLTSGIDEADLPDQEEYFTDDATLDKFLEDIELKN